MSPDRPPHAPGQARSAKDLRVRIAAWAIGTVVGALVLLVLGVMVIDWSSLRGPIGVLATRVSGRPIAIRGSLDVDALTLSPRIRIEGLEVGATRVYGVGAPPLAEIAALDVRVRLLPLLIGRVEIDELTLHGASIDARRRADGVTNCSSGGPERALRLPLIRRLEVAESRLVYVDQRRGLTIDAAFATEETLAQGGVNGRFHMRGTGTLQGRPLALDLTGAPLVNVRRDRPYPFALDVRMAGTRVDAQGVIAQPFNLTRLSAALRASGPDLADLYFLTGAVLPNTPPYHLAASLQRDGARLVLTGIAGRIGDSDFAGALAAVKPAGGRLKVTGRLVSRALDLDDLLVVLGGAPDPRETASPDQSAHAAALARSDRLLPDANLDIARVGNMDADLAVAAASVRAGRLPIRSLSARVTLDRGLLRIDPATVDLAPGRITGFAEIDARQGAAPRVRVDFRLTGGRLESVFTAKKSIAPAISGPVRARAQLAGSGASVRSAAAAADGRITVFAPSGAVREAFAELTGINVARGLGLLVTGDKGTIAIRCAAADFEIKNGIARARTFVADTQTMRIGGAGAFSLRDETLDLRIRGEPKEPRLVRVAAPIRVRGRFRSPTLGLEAGGLVRQGGAAAVLGAVLAPLAAVLAFVDPGDAPDADCNALKARTAR